MSLVLMSWTLALTLTMVGLALITWTLALTLIMMSLTLSGWTSTWFTWTSFSFVVPLLKQTKI